ncbi:hypothetical protein L198_01631 [Cryptococcus wingfieldii CBS 7118]|uniref:Uncharacterized protein n=1 Tax=Cryptococcus wingfieldii CBS 7118 TaxID=1295528 RepID=A0A1E3K016_9TREE|nr:hypothetical protein L198_01631 [Cryptococcus wingfieldii CBS 7118]ODO06399.1 hypothetical protein L198_01631 [Cryptococcus wingfieldii CBS 7118]
MTRRSPPSHLTLLPTHIPTPPRGAPKFFLPHFPCSLPTTCSSPIPSVPLGSYAYPSFSPSPPTEISPATHSRSSSSSSTSSHSSPGHKKSLSLTTSLPPPPPEIVSEKRYITPTDAAGDGRKVAPWLRSRGFDQAGREMGVERVLRPLEGALVMRR